MPEFKKYILVIIGGFYIGQLTYSTTATILPCAENRTDSCIENLATFTTLDKPRFAGEIELERLCREAENGHHCSAEFLRLPSCVTPEEQVFLGLQIDRSQAVSQMLCSNSGYITDPVFRKLYLKHESCIDEYQRKIKECHVSSGVIEDPDFEVVKNSSKTDKEKHKEICCPLVQYIECADNAIERSCGTEAKEVVFRILMKMSGKHVVSFCTNIDPEFPNSPTKCMDSAANH